MERTSARDASTPLAGIQSVERAARMLTIFTLDEPELTLAELTARMEMSKATAHRYATALRQAGLLRLNRGAYSLGPRVVEMAPVALAALGVVEMAGPYMRQLVADTGQTAAMSVWDGEAPVVVRVDDNPALLVRIIVATGSRLPLDSAQGQVFQAFLGGDADVDGAAIRDARLAADAHVVEGIAALAAPVFQGDEIVATLALVGTAAAIETESDGAMARALRGAAEALSAELGFVLPEGSDG